MSCYVVSSKERRLALLQAAVLLLKRWIRFLAQEIVQSSPKETKRTLKKKQQQKNKQESLCYKRKSG